MGSSSILPTLGIGARFSPLQNTYPVRGIALQAHAVDRVGIRDLNHLVAFHDVQPDTRQARVRLVVDEDVPAVIGAVGVGRAGMVQVTVEIGLLAAELRGTACPRASGPRS